MLSEQPTKNQNPLQKNTYHVEEQTLFLLQHILPASAIVTQLLLLKHDIQVIEMDSEETGDSDGERSKLKNIKGCEGQDTAATQHVRVLAQMIREERYRTTDNQDSTPNTPMHDHK